jgi:hypothetical protein
VIFDLPVAGVIWTQDDLDNLKAAVASGVLTVSYDGPPRRSITYQSLAEMRKLLAEMVQQVHRPATVRLVAHRRGFRDGE